MQILNELEERYHMNCQNWGFLRFSALVDVPEQKVLGWDKTCCDSGACYQFFSAEEPLHGMTRPQQVPCPMGLSCFMKWETDWHQALNNIEHQFGHIEFESITLTKVLYHNIEHPNWHFHTCCGRDFIVDADTGKVELIQSEAAHITH